MTNVKTNSQSYMTPNGTARNHADEIANAREQHRAESYIPGDGLPYFATLREGDMVEDGRGFPVVLIIAAAVFTLMVLGAWLIWADPVGRTAATVMQAQESK